MIPTAKDIQRTTNEKAPEGAISQTLTSQPLMPEPQKGIEPLTACSRIVVSAAVSLSVEEDSGLSSGTQPVETHGIATRTTTKRQPDDGFLTVAQRAALEAVTERKMPSDFEYVAAWEVFDAVGVDSGTEAELNCRTWDEQRAPTYRPHRVVTTYATARSIVHASQAEHDAIRNIVEGRPLLSWEVDALDDLSRRIVLTTPDALAVQP